MISMKKQVNILLAVTGGIAAYKSAELARQFIKESYNVKVIMTEHAKSFIHSNTFYAITGNCVFDSLFDNQTDPMAHIHLAKWADYIVIAPATASIISKLSHGLCDDLLTTTILASKAKMFIAPAMNKVMWENTFTQENVSKLKQQENICIIDPDIGEQACGDIGAGKMAQLEVILDYIKLEINLKENIASPWKGKSIVITAGPTEEVIDPVRYISNRSSGKMGYALAKAFSELGADVILISGPVSIKRPQVNLFVPVESTESMYDAVFDHINECDVFICAAAVADYRMLNPNTQKLKKSDDKDSLIIELVKNPDILASVGQLDSNTRPKIIGFAAETDNLIENAKAKLIKKNADMIIANEVKSSGEPFNSDFNQVTVLHNNDKVVNFKSETKEILSYQLVDLMAKELFKKTQAKCVEKQECLDLC